jgi:hypothetical protein
MPNRPTRIAGLQDHDGSVASKIRAPRRRNPLKVLAFGVVK